MTTIGNDGGVEKPRVVERPLDDYLTVGPELRGDTIGELRDPRAAADWPGGGDWFYFHTVSRFEFGFLHGYSTNSSDFHFHSPYQVQAEFLADVAELSRPQIPVVITQTARARGNTILSSAFVNGTPYRIRNPRPW